MFASLKNYKQVLQVAGLALLLFALWQLLLSPQYQAYSRAKLASKKIQDQLANINKDLDQISVLQKEIEAVEPSNLDKLNKTLPYGENLEEFLSNMHKLAQQSGLIIITMNVRPIDPIVGQESAVQVSQLTMSLKGTYPDFLDFMRSLERHTRLVDADTLSVARVSSNQTRAEVLNINLSASVYHLQAIPSVPLFPFGQKLNTSVFETEQFRALQVLVPNLPVNSPSEPNPFASQ